MARRAWLASLAAPFLLAMHAASAAPVLTGSHNGPSIWEEHGAGRTDGLAVGAYPLPPQPERDGHSDAQPIDDGAKERWLRRHYQWLRALGDLQGAPSAVSDGAAAEPRGGGSLSRPEPRHGMRVGDMVVLYGDESFKRMTPHLLDDGARFEDPEAELSRDEALGFIVSDRLIVESAKFVAEHFSALTEGFRASFGSARDYPRAPGPKLVQAEYPQFAAPSSLDGLSPGAPPRQDRPGERISVFGFFKRIALDILSAPTTYLLAFLAVLGWLILRVAVFSRD